MTSNPPEPVEQVFHFTSAAHLPWIVTDGYLRPTRHITRRPDGARFVWFSTDGRKPDRTSSAIQYWPELWMRFAVPLDATLPWREACAAAGWSAAEIQLAAKAVPPEMRDWWRVAPAGTFVLTDDVVLTGRRGDRWQAISPEIEVRGDTATVRWAQRSVVVRRHSHAGPHGQTLYAVWAAA
jgi:hypothetical protein